MKIPEVIGIFAATSSLINSTTSLTAGLITNFASRFAAFDEYRILKFVITIRPVTANVNGVLVAWVEPLSSGTPTATNAQTNVTNYLMLNNSHGKAIRFSYQPADPGFQVFQPISTTSFVYGYLKQYTSTADFGSNLASATGTHVTAEIVIQFRGLA
jgi:hypothetical protein